jgi:hypothetical protein
MDAVNQASEGIKIVTIVPMAEITMSLFQQHHPFSFL